MCKNDFKYFSQEFDSKVLDLVKKRWFYSYEYMSCFEKFKKNIQVKKSFIVHWWVQNAVIKYEHVLKIEMKTMIDYHNLHLK